MLIINLKFVSLIFGVTHEYTIVNPLNLKYSVTAPNPGFKPALACLLLRFPSTPAFFCQLLPFFATETSRGQTVLKEAVIVFTYDNEILSVPSKGDGSQVHVGGFLKKGLYP